MSGLGDLIRAYEIAEKLLRGLKRAQLEAVDAALRGALPALEEFGRVVASENSAEIARQSEDVAEHLESVARELESGGLNPGPFAEAAKRVKTANTWEEFFPDKRKEYQQLSPTLIAAVKRLQQQVQEKLAQRP
jgi:hypothetical protein